MVRVLLGFHFSSVGRLSIPWPLALAILSPMMHSSQVSNLGRDGLDELSPTTSCPMDLGARKAPAEQCGRVSCLHTALSKRFIQVQTPRVSGDEGGETTWGSVPFTPLFNSC